MTPATAIATGAIGMLFIGALILAVVAMVHAISTSQEIE